MSAVTPLADKDRRDAFEKNQAPHNEKSRTSSRLPAGWRLRQAYFLIGAAADEYAWDSDS